MSKRLRRLALVPLLVVVLVVPTYVGAQDGDTPLPPMESGTWMGSVGFEGYRSTDLVRSDGSYQVTVVDVINDTDIRLTFVVDGNGVVSSGRMTVNIVWFSEGVGTQPVIGDAYRVRHAHFETASLAITGSSDRLVATGDLSDDSVTSTGNDAVVEEVTGIKTGPVEWVFSIDEVNCARVQGRLYQATGRSIMVSALTPRETIEEGYEDHNALEAPLLAYPSGLETADEVWETLEMVDAAADAIRDREIPETIHFLELVEVWGDLSAELASLDECQQTDWVGGAPQSTRSWLTDILRDGVQKALDNAEYYEAPEFIHLWEVLYQERSMTSDLEDGIVEALDIKLDEAIAEGDDDTIIDILGFAALYRGTRLYDKAKAALEGGTG